MAIENYRDMSQGGSDFNAGFQFEFSCARCKRSWRSPFKPYRMGQVTGFLSRFAFLLPSARTAGRTTGNFADFGSRGAKESALAEAMAQAERIYQTCPSCRDTVCEDCVDSRQGVCTDCVRRAGENARADRQREAAETRELGASACPNCRTPSSGGRFCAECGFDMASTHKSCPGCGETLSRSARFCTNCGHSF